MITAKMMIAVFSVWLVSCIAYTFCKNRECRYGVTQKLGAKIFLKYYKDGATREYIGTIDKVDDKHVTLLLDLPPGVKPQYRTFLQCNIVHVEDCA